MINSTTGYCLKCKSKLYPADEGYIKHAGVCSYCVTFDNTPDKRFQKLYNENLINERKNNTHSKRRRI